MIVDSERTVIIHFDLRQQKIRTTDFHLMGGNN